MKKIKLKNKDELEIISPFQTLIYKTEKLEFLETAKKVSYEYLQRNKIIQENIHDLYPARNTEPFHQDIRLKDFSKYVINTAWKILFDQGYNMNAFNTVFQAMWCQEHHKYSGQDQHIHGHLAQLVAFYFLDCPKDCSKAIFHDPRQSKVISNLPEDFSKRNMDYTCFNERVFDPTPGTLIFSNSWLPHSFTKNGSDEPFRFIHINIGAVPMGMQHNNFINQPVQSFQNPAEVI